MLNIGFTESKADPSLYNSSLNDFFVILLVSIDDVKVPGSSKRRIDMVVQKDGSKYTVRVIADAKQFLGVFIENTQVFVKLQSCPLLEHMLEFFKMGGFCPIHVPLPSGTNLSLSGTALEE